MAIKKEDYWNDLLLRNEPYDIRTDLQDNSKHSYVGCKTYGSYNNLGNKTTQIKYLATGRVYKIRRANTCSTENITYIDYCLNCQKQEVG